MAGALIKIDEEIVTSAVASVVLTGIDSNYDVYQLVISNMQPVTDNKNSIFRITKSGSADTTANYDHAFKFLNAAGSYGNSAGTNATSATFAWSQGNGTGEVANAVLYLFDFANASEYSFMTVESNWRDITPDFVGAQGGIAHTVASASDGVSITMESGVNINTGAKFTLYGLKK